MEGERSKRGKGLHQLAQFLASGAGERVDCSELAKSWPIMSLHPLKTHAADTGWLAMGVLEPQSILHRSNLRSRKEGEILHQRDALARHNVLARTWICARDRSGTFLP